METPIQRWRYDRRQFFTTLSAIRQAADEIDQFSLPGLRQRIDAVQTFLVQGFPPHWTELIVEDQAELSRLATKLDALRERLIYSYFGSAQLRSLQEVLYDLHEIMARDLAKAGEIDLRFPDEEVSAPEREKALAG